MSPMWQSAMEAADEARLPVEHGRYRGAVSRSYYAVFTAARCLLVEKGGYKEREVRRHTAVLRLFSERFVLTGSFDREIGRRFHTLSEERASADYEPLPVGEDDARQAIAFMERFLSQAAELRDKGPKP